MAERKQFATSIDIAAADRFRIACEDRGVKMNVVLEAFMNQFAENQFAVKISRTGITLIPEENDKN